MGMIPSQNFIHSDPKLDIAIDSNWLVHNDPKFHNVLYCPLYFLHPGSVDNSTDL